MMLHRPALVLMLGLSLVPLAHAQSPAGTAFTYQGRLFDGGNPASGAYDLQLALFDAPAGGAQVGATIVKDDVAVDAGLFTVSLDFGGGAFTGLRALAAGRRAGGREHRRVHADRAPPGAAARAPRGVRGERPVDGPHAASPPASRTASTTTAAATSRESLRAAA